MIFEIRYYSSEVVFQAISASLKNTLNFQLFDFRLDTSLNMRTIKRKLLAFYLNSRILVWTCLNAPWTSLNWNSSFPTHFKTMYRFSFKDFWEEKSGRALFFFFVPVKNLSLTPPCVARVVWQLRTFYNETTRHFVRNKHATGLRQREFTT